MAWRTAVVGAGVSGLAAALELARRSEVTLIDRLPTTGGMSGWAHPEVRRLSEACRAAGVVEILGATALRWDGQRLLVARPGGIHWLAIDHVVYAGGWRPATQAEIGLVGSRPAGLLPATVAIHLLEAGTRLGRRPVLVGTTHWAATVARHIHRSGLRVTVVTAGEGPRPAYADAWWPGWEAISIAGTDRVERLDLRRLGQTVALPCDAVILAADPRPLRNVDGAVHGGTNVTYVQPDVQAATAMRILTATGIARGINESFQEAAT